MEDIDETIMQSWVIPNATTNISIKLKRLKKLLAKWEKNNL